MSFFSKEETGIKAKFVGILCVRQITKFRFNNTHDITFLCVLIVDTNENENNNFAPDPTEIEKVTAKFQKNKKLIKLKINIK